MIATTKPLFDLTAADLMSGLRVSLGEWMPLREAADELFRSRIHGAPVVDTSGRCTRVLSVSDLARWAVRKKNPPSMQPRTCSHQEVFRAVHGSETTVCTLSSGSCALQTPKCMADGREIQVCREPNSVCLE